RMIGSSSAIRTMLPPCAALVAGMPNGTKVPPFVPSTEGNLSLANRKTRPRPTALRPRKHLPLMRPLINFHEEKSTNAPDSPGDQSARDHQVSPDHKNGTSPVPVARGREPRYTARPRPRGPIGTPRNCCGGSHRVHRR